MRALVSDKPGNSSTLEMRDIAIPEPGPGEVRISIRVCAINYPDVLAIEDKHQSKPVRPFSPGIEVSGIVDAVGPDVTGLSVGTRIMSQTNFGGLAEYAIALETSCVPIPDAMPFQDAAAFTIVYGTGYYALVERAGLSAGQTLLVLGASGGVGLAAVQLGKALGARVVAAVSTDAKATAARNAGADETLVYPPDITDQKALAAMFKAACPNGANVVFDPVGGMLAEPAIRALAWDGRYLVIGFAGGIPRVPLNLLLLRGGHAIGIFWGAAAAREPIHHRNSLMTLLDMYQAGQFRPIISEVFPLEQAATALDRLSDRHAVGKVVVEI